MSTRIYIEGGGDSKELHARCREGFRRLLEKCGFKGRMPRLVACGSRTATYDDFLTAQSNARDEGYIALLVDSEDIVTNAEQPWEHLKQRDNWNKPAGANDEQVLFMTTCMETWLTSDRQALREHYSGCLQENALPHLSNMESRSRNDVQDALVQATRTCKRKYAKGKKSFEVVARLNPVELRKHLPSFVRFERILKAKLK